jgi:hypothetical protein
MSNLPAIGFERVADLFPLRADDAARVIISSVLTDEIEDGKPVLTRSISTSERHILNVRMKQLADALQSAKTTEIRAAVSQMLVGFNKSASKDEAQAVVAQYIFALQHLPIWAIKRACGKFARGEVSANDVEGVNRAFAPTTAQLHQVTTDVAEQWYVEMSNVKRVLIGAKPYVMNPEEKERVRERITNLATMLKARDRALDEKRSSEIEAKNPYKSPTDEELYARYGRRDSGVASCSNQQAESTERP